MNILGISCFYHDAAAALLVDGQLVAAAEEERFSRKKHDSEFPKLAIQFCLEQAGIGDQRPRLRRLLREAVREVRAHPHHRAAGRAALVEGLRRCDDHLAPRQAVGEELHPPGARRLRPTRSCSASITCRTPPARSSARRSTRRRSSPSTASASGPCATFGRGTRQRDLAAARDPLPAFGRPALQRLHRLPRLRGQRGRVQGHGHGAVRRAPVRRQGPEALSRSSATAASGSTWTTSASTTRRPGPTISKFVDLFGEPRDPDWQFFTESSGFPSYFGDKPADFDAHRRAQPVLRRHRRQHPAGAPRRSSWRWRARCTSETGPRQALHGRRRGAQQRRQRPHPPRDAVQGALHPAGGRRRRRRARRGAVRASLRARHSRARSAWSTPTGARRTPTREVGDFLRGAGIAHTRCSQRGRAARPRRRPPAQRATSSAGSRAASSGARARSARAASSPIRGRARHEGHRQHQDQVPRAVPAVRAVGAGRRGGALLRSRPMPARHYPARFMLYVVDVKPGQGEVLPAITHVDNTARLQTVHKDREPALLQPDRALRSGDRRAGDPQHVLQPEGRADRHHARAGAQHVHAQRHGRAGARQLHRHQGLTSPMAALGLGRTASERSRRLLAGSFSPPSASRWRSACSRSACACCTSCPIGSGSPTRSSGRR